MVLYCSLWSEAVAARGRAAGRKRLRRRRRRRAERAAGGVEGLAQGCTSLRRPGRGTRDANGWRRGGCGGESGCVWCACVCVSIVCVSCRQRRRSRACHEGSKQGRRDRARRNTHSAIEAGRGGGRIKGQPEPKGQRRRVASLHSGWPFFPIFSPPFDSSWSRPPASRHAGRCPPGLPSKPACDSACLSPSPR